MPPLFVPFSAAALQGPPSSKPAAGVAAILLAALLPLAVQAQTADPSQTEVITLPLGQLTMSADRDNFITQISDGRSELSFETGFLPSEHGRSGNAVLLFIASGGTACPGQFIWVTLDAAGLRATPEFGTCSDLVELQQSPDGITARIPRLDGSGTSAFTFDGDSVTEADLGPQQAGISAPRDAEAWAGKWAGEVLSAAEMEPLLLEIMPNLALVELRLAGQIASSGMEPDGDWYAASGCRPHFCGDELAGVAISRRDGRVVAMHWTREGGATLYGDPGGPLPHKLEAVSAGEL